MNSSTSSPTTEGLAAHGPLSKGAPSLAAPAKAAANASALAKAPLSLAPGVSSSAARGFFLIAFQKLARPAWLAALLAFSALSIALLPAAGALARTELSTKAAQYGYEEGLVKAKAESKFIMAYFWTTWCVNCAQFNEAVLGDPKVVEALERHFVLVPLDADIEKDLSRKYMVRVVPTTLFLSPSGEPATILPGVAPPDMFLSILDYVSSNAYLDMEYDEYYALGPDAPKPEPEIV